MSAYTWAVVLLAGLACVSANGTETSLEEYPSLVQVEFRVGVLWLQQCVGNVITNYHILSTATCFLDENLTTRRVRAGAAVRGVGGEVRTITRIAHHPSFGVLDQDGDIAMIVLSSALPLGSNIQQAPIMGEGIYLPEGLGLTLVGWGTTAEGGLIGNDNLYKIDVYTVNDDRCLEVYIGEKFVTENMFCVRRLGANGLDFDSRDAGAPVIYSGTTAGILAFGKSRENDEFPVVSTALASYTNWIMEQATQL